ncbi:hypothetical protein RCL_jg7865.t1 [Rhizophagus clarus]|uniref:Uncharacterized protein n=1 Tax=Rhizophagus clarus TaxID=94130 RepID=A0A8H3L282_9GLOM|nr:hypothetical protein RCL_jg21498.t1 [Rhizophagus clarus]GET04456.1 hypothetical protein RCL_jg7865.t1 [Rhizophagus clarus]
MKLEIFHNSGNLFGQSPKTCARAFIYPASSPSIGQVHSNQLDIPVFTFRISNGLSVITKCREHAENHASWRASVDQWSIACILISKLSLDLVYNRTKGCIKFIRFWYSWIFSCVLKNSNVRKKYSINSLFKIRIFIISSKVSYPYILHVEHNPPRSSRFFQYYTTRTINSGIFFRLKNSALCNLYKL